MSILQCLYYKIDFEFEMYSIV